MFVDEVVRNFFPLSLLFPPLDGVEKSDIFTRYMPSMRRWRKMDVKQKLFLS